jgi:alpha-tubulin suppressor-like RCC1 family protein
MIKTRRVGFILIVVAAPTIALGACDDGSDKTLDREPRNTNPAPEAGEAAAPDAPIDAPAADAPADAPADADAAVPKGVSAIATGAGPHTDPLVGNGDHTCAIGGASRSMYCWGANDHGQLGVGSTFDGGALAEDLTQPLRASVDEQGFPFTGVDEISLAAWHSCARRANDLYCWGQRYSGAQGEPSFALNPDRTKPRLLGNFPIARVAAGGPHTCAVRATGKIACFGHSSFGELGRAPADHPACTAPIFYDYAGVATHTCSGELLETTKPVTGIQGLAAGEIHDCAVTGGNAKCWGSNDKGQLGGGAVGTSSPDPVEVVTDPVAKTPLANVTAIASGGGKHTCALAAGKVWCWGANDKGQLGTDPIAAPTRAYAGVAASLDAIVTIGVADGVSCLATGDGSAYCWGADDVGQLGDGETTNKSAPVSVKGPGGLGKLTGVVAIAPGTRHVCALRNDGTVWCWGKNDRGQLGDGTKTDSPFPVKVKGLPE